MTKIPKYYFVYYECDYFITGSSLHENRREKTYHQEIIDTHPLAFQLIINENSEEFKGDEELKFTQEYKVISWQRITLEEYNEFKGKIG